MSAGAVSALLRGQDTDYEETEEGEEEDEEDPGIPEEPPPQAAPPRARRRRDPSQDLLELLQAVMAEEDEAPSLEVVTSPGRLLSIATGKLAKWTQVQQFAQMQLQVAGLPPVPPRRGPPVRAPPGWPANVGRVMPAVPLGPAPHLRPSPAAPVAPTAPAPVPVGPAAGAASAAARLPSAPAGPAAPLGPVEAAHRGAVAPPPPAATIAPVLLEPAATAPGPTQAVEADLAVMLMHISEDVELPNGPRAAA